MNTAHKYRYCKSLTHFERYPTTEVAIGDLKLGYGHPIRIQSMTNTDTMDTKATVAQAIRMACAGCELVRITAPGIKSAANLQFIKDELHGQGYKQPLVADIHFNPNAATTAAAIVEKVRINPGNFVDKKNFKTIDYTDEEYAQELERIREHFIPLINLCKKKHTALRIGTNHGSLSDRIMSRYGDTPHGMVESTMEFLRICYEQDFHHVVISMKASNTRIMVYAYRLLVHQMENEGMRYPLHLGVTEAGEGEDGRIKSAVGIGCLLADGLGDTIRVSLTEDPELEIPVAQQLVAHFNTLTNHAPITPLDNEWDIKNPFDYTKRETLKVLNIGENDDPVIIADFGKQQPINYGTLTQAGHSVNAGTLEWKRLAFPADYLYIGNNNIDIELPEGLSVICDFETWRQTSRDHFYPLFNKHQFIEGDQRSTILNFVSLTYADLDAALLKLIEEDTTTVVVLQTDHNNGFAEQRAAFLLLMQKQLKTPIIIKRDYCTDKLEDFQLKSAADTGGLFIDGFGDGLWLSNTGQGAMFGTSEVVTTAFGILQASRVRTSKTEYISCPSCGRTLFDLQETTAKIRTRTAHLTGLKIGIMGCIVNGPGEMADADYGYVGSGAGRITLYKGKQVVKKSLESEKAVDELIALIKEHGDWVEPEDV